MDRWIDRDRFREASTASLYNTHNLSECKEGRPDQAQPLRLSAAIKKVPELRAHKDVCERGVET